MVLLSLAYRSLKNRKLTMILTLVSLALALASGSASSISERYAGELSNTISQTDLIVGAVVIAALVVGLIPAWKAYRNALSDGLSVRV